MASSPTAGHTLVRVEHLGFAYPHHRPVLHDLHLEVHRGVTLLLGLNGAGKSTLFNIMLGKFAPTAGTVSVLDGLVTPGTPTAITTSRVGFLPQAFGFPPRVSALDFVTYIGWLRGLTWSDGRTRARQILRRVDLGPLDDRPLGELSGGMLRRVGIAQALVHDPDLVLLDEPMAGLDPAQRIEVRDLLVEEARHRSFLIATHILDDIERLADEVVILHDGRAVFAGSPSSLAGISSDHRDGVTAWEAAFLQLTGPNRGTP
ncbi:MAG: transporter ATP-binding protein [Actinomycetota bacterium]|jgi:ABC-2 type transport system ATP-binding protein